MGLSLCLPYQKESCTSPVGSCCASESTILKELTEVKGIADTVPASHLHSYKVARAYEGGIYLADWHGDYCNECERHDIELLTPDPKLAEHYYTLAANAGNVAAKKWLVDRERARKYQDDRTASDQMRETLNNSKH